MKGSKHIMVTWILGVFLHPVIYIIYYSVPEKDLAGAFVSSFVMGLFFSLPAFILTRHLFYVLAKKECSLSVKFMVLISGAASSVFNVAIVFSFLTSGSHFIDLVMQMSIPGVIAASISPLIMYRKLSEHLKPHF